MNNADLVYKIAVECPFTRCMAIFLGNTDVVVGPVRSSRYYFSRICAEWSAIAYKYHPDEQKYYRYINQKPSFDKSCGEEIKVSNIIVQYASIDKIIDKIENDDQGRVNAELIGEGIGKVFTGGIYQIVRWIKKDKDDQTIFLNEDGSPITYNQGITWVHILCHDSEMWFKSS